MINLSAAEMAEAIEHANDALEIFASDPTAPELKVSRALIASQEEVERLRDGVDKLVAERLACLSKKPGSYAWSDGWDACAQGVAEDWAALSEKKPNTHSSVE